MLVFQFSKQNQYDQISMTNLVYDDQLSEPGIVAWGGFILCGFFYEILTTIYGRFEDNHGKPETIMLTVATGIESDSSRLLAWKVEPLSQ